MTLKQKLKYWRNKGVTWGLQMTSIRRGRVAQFDNMRLRESRKGEGKSSRLPGQVFWAELCGENIHLLWKVFKVGKGNRGFRVLRRELVFSGARRTKVQRRGGGQKGFCWWLILSSQRPRHSSFFKEKKNFFYFIDLKNNCTMSENVLKMSYKES